MHIRELIRLITKLIFLYIISPSVVQCRHWYCEVCESAVSVQAWPWACRSWNLSSIPDGGKRFLLIFTRYGTALGLTQPLILWIEALSSGVKWLESEVSHSSPCSAALNNECGYTGVLSPTRKETSYIPRIYGTWRFITTFTRVHHLSLP